jgi:predicted NACHT family NTPase
VTAFWKQLPNATVEGNVLRLAGDTTFLGSSKLPDRMYIRDDYVKLWMEIQGLVSSGLSRIVVSGNPGIGKSWFGLYIAFMLLSRSQPPTNCMGGATQRNAHFDPSRTSAGGVSRKISERN